MSWVNAFSLGPCAIQVVVNGFVMSASDMTAAGLSVIESNGVVTLSWNGQGSTPPTCVVNVGPSYALTVNGVALTPAQLINASYQTVIFNGIAYIVTDGVNLGSGSTAPLPNPWIPMLGQNPSQSIGMQATGQHGV